jgi:hypothetical protein
MTAATRIEQDAFGPVEIPSDRLNCATGYGMSIFRQSSHINAFWLSL